MTDPIYLDNNASTQLAPEVLEQMLPVLTHTGNASSAHNQGQWARSAVERARQQVADLLAVSGRNVVFTSGATEANNLAILGAAHASDPTRDHIVTCATEHPAVLDTVRALAGQGFRSTIVGVDRSGVIDLDELATAVDDNTVLVSVMSANNETGVLAPLAEVAEISHASGALLHTDATQIMAWGPFSMADAGVDLLSLSAHKFHGPQGVGALIVPSGIQTRLRPVVHGGSHERGLRSGTLNAAGIVGLGAAAQLVSQHEATSSVETRRRRDLLHNLLDELLKDLRPILNGHRERRVPGTLNLTFESVPSDMLQAAVPGVAMSDGSACSVGAPGPSHVLKAMGLSDDQAEASVRLTLSRLTTDDEVTTAAAAIAQGVHTVRTRLGMAVAR